MGGVPGRGGGVRSGGREGRGRSGQDGSINVANTGRGNAVARSASHGTHSNGSSFGREDGAQPGRGRGGGRQNAPGRGGRGGRGGNGGGGSGRDQPVDSGAFTGMQLKHPVADR